MRWVTGSIVLVAYLILCGHGIAAETAGFRGRVLDLDGRPVAGAKIFFYEGSNVRKPADFISPPSDEQGKIAAVLPAGKYRAVARIKQGALFGPLMPGDRHSGEPMEIEIEPGSEANADFTVADIREIGQKRRTAAGDLRQVRGRVLDQQGKPVADAYVFARPAKQGDKVPEYLSPWTGPDGVYRLYLPEKGRFFLGASRRFPPPSKAVATVESGEASQRSVVEMDVQIPVSGNDQTTE